MECWSVVAAHLLAGPNLVCGDGIRQLRVLAGEVGEPELVEQPALLRTVFVRELLEPVSQCLRVRTVVGYLGDLVARGRR